MREVHEDIGGERGTGYTTVLKLLQIMAEKGLVDREESQRAHLYRATVSQHELQGSLLRDLSRKLFAGSPARLALHALSLEAVTDEEVAELRALIETRRTGDRS